MNSPNQGCSKPAPIGGAATFYGILFQILGSLEWASRLALTRPSSDSVQLVLEPSDGGDIQVHLPGKRIVEQWKSKADNKTWAISALIEKVLPDLYRAVDLDRKDDDYIFRTEGQKGSWKKLESFLKVLKGTTPPEDIISTLDDTTEINFSRGLHLTQRAMFLHICKKIRSHAEFKTDTDTLTYRKVWRLLANFSFDGNIQIKELILKIDLRLSEIADFIDDVPHKRDELCGILINLSTAQDSSISPGKLLAKAGLRALSIRDLPVLKATLRDRFEYKLARTGYDSTLDVRKPLDIDMDCVVNVIQGDSGQGKTWQLASTAASQAARGKCVIWIPAHNDHRIMLQDAANEVWCRALLHDQKLDLQAIARRFLEHNKGVNHWLTVCIDDLRSLSALKLLLEEQWASLGVRFLITIPDTAGDIPSGNSFQGIKSTLVRDFTAGELHEYMERNELDWTSLSSAMRSTLRRPLLAKLYCDVTHSQTMSSATEYDLYHAYWLRFLKFCSGRRKLKDATLMKALVLKLFEDSCSYPWPRSALHAVGVDDNVEEGLFSVGWLRDTGEDDVEVWHDRLLRTLA